MQDISFQPMRGSHNLALIRLVNFRQVSQIKYK